MRLPWSAQDDLPPVDAAVARLLAAASASPAQDELVGEAAACAAFVAAGPDPNLRSAPVDVRRFARRLAAVSFATAFGLGGVAAAYAGALPESSQRLAHDALGPLGVPDHADDHAKDQAAKRADRKKLRATPSPSAANASASHGPDVNGAAKAGLCNAWFASGKPKNESSTAFGNLTTAAGGPDKVEAFCADVRKDHPSSKPSVRPSRTAKPKPSHTPRPEHSAESGRPSHAGRPSDAGKPTS